jgi:hypothetical protein
VAKEDIAAMDLDTSPFSTMVITTIISSLQLPSASAERSSTTTAMLANYTNFSFQGLQIFKWQNLLQHQQLLVQDITEALNLQVPSISAVERRQHQQHQQQQLDGPMDNLSHNTFKEPAWQHEALPTLDTAAKRMYFARV